MDESSITSLKNENEGRNDLTEELPSDKSEEESVLQEEMLKMNLDKLRKQNFILQASIKSWQTTLKNKLEEFKMTELNLDEVRNEIWSEREKFCSKADEFNSSYGILSDWWESQMKFVSGLETLQQKSSEDQECREKIQKLEQEVERLKMEVNNAQRKKEVAEVEVHATDDGNVSKIRKEKEDTARDISPEATGSKKGRYSEEEENIEVYEVPETSNDVLYSMVDLQKVRAAKNRKKTQKKKQKSHFLRKIQNFLKS